MTVRYIVAIDEDGNPEVLYRFIAEKGKAAVPFYLHPNGNWIERWEAYNIQNELHNPFYEVVEEAKAMQIAKELYGVDITSDELIAA